MLITSSCSLTPGTYHLPNGIHIGAGNVTVDMSDVCLVGSGNGNGFGITVTAQTAVKIVGGSVRGYFYGLRIEESSLCTVTGTDLSHNWHDPHSTCDKAPWLDINAPPNLSDKQNLGGGVFALRCEHLTLQHVTASVQENGFDLYHTVAAVLENCTACNCSGWGVHLHNTSHSHISHSKFNQCIRPGLGDSAGILLVNDSHHNTGENTHIHTHSSPQHDSPDNSDGYVFS